MKTFEKNVDESILESIVNDDPREFGEADFSVGSVSHQGDLIFVRIKNLPKSSKPRDNRQLADGNTQGSRHVLSVGRVFDCDVEQVIQEISAVCKGVIVESQYIGPVIQTVEGVADVVHPEHGDHFYRGDMTIACVYQRSLDSEQRAHRVRD